MQLDAVSLIRWDWKRGSIIFIKTDCGQPGNLFEVSHVQIFQLFRCFHDQKILQKTFGEWKEWWTVCRERKLSLRADSHYRFVKWLAIFVCIEQYETFSLGSEGFINTSKQVTSTVPLGQEQCLHCLFSYFSSPLFFFSFVAVVLGWSQSFLSNISLECNWKNPTSRHW